MEMPAIDIDAVPLLETAVGLFGSPVAGGASADGTVVDITVTLIMIVHD